MIFQGTLKRNWKLKPTDLHSNEYFNAVFPDGEGRGAIFSLPKSYLPQVTPFCDP
jgi:hypothetical protein